MNGEIVLEAVRLTKHYGSLAAVDGLDLQVQRGEVFGFLGPNGAGKTTSIHMLCGLLQPDAGAVRLNGQPVTGKGRCRVGLCPQQTVLWEKLTCYEQLVYVGQLYGLSATQAGKRAERLLGDLDLGEKRNQLAGKLSGGMQRRLNLALALVHDPEILVLDEPEAGLDPQSRVMAREYIHRLAGEKTVILTTHNMDEAERLADRVAIIDHGKLLVLDTPQRLKERLGAGDVLELRLNGAAVDLEKIQAAIQQRAPELLDRTRMELIENVLTLRGLDLVTMLPVMLEALRSLGLNPIETRLRANTLEDVFIALTGRGLRE